MAEISALTDRERQVVLKMRELSVKSDEWKLEISAHRRGKNDSFIQFAETVFSRIPVKDRFALVD